MVLSIRLLCFFLFIYFVSAQNDFKCGTNGPIQSKIVGGEEATPYEWPWTVSLGYFYNLPSGQEEYFSTCTGSLFQSQFVLTAAHCASVMSENKPSVVAAVHNISLKAPEQRKVFSSIEKFINHPNFKVLPNNSTIFDLAIVKLTKPLDIAGNPDLGTICVPAQDSWSNTYKGKLVTAVGWGRTKDGDSNSKSQVLRKVTVPIADMDYCTKYYNLQEAVDTMICTYQMGKSICKGDSGGPLMLKADNGRWTVVGVSSWVGGCGKVSSGPNMFAHVSFMSKWIWSTVKAYGR